MIKNNDITTNIIWWPVIAIILCLIFSWLFWFLWFNLLSWEILGIGMGLGGALYFIFFTPPVLIAASIYEFIFALLLKNRVISRSKRLLYTLWLPFIIIAVLLIVFCPMDSPYWYPVAFYKAIIEWF